MYCSLLLLLLLASIFFLLAHPGAETRQRPQEDFFRNMAAVWLSMLGNGRSRLERDDVIEAYRPLEEIFYSRRLRKQKGRHHRLNNAAVNGG